MIIDISEEVYQEICYKNYYSLKGKEALRIGVINGTVLPKGHGRLIDADDIDNHIVGSVDTRDCPTIIEADTENEV